VWAGSPLAAYADEFTSTDFVVGWNMCQPGGSHPARNYSFNLAKRSIVIATLVSISPSWAYSTIGHNGVVCGSNSERNESGSGIAATATCTAILEKGLNNLHFCTFTGATPSGSILVTPLE